MNRSTSNWIMSTITCRHCFRRVAPADIQRDFLCRPCHLLADLFPMGELNRRRRGHVFLPSLMLNRMPERFTTEDTPCSEKTLYLHYFAGGMDWYIAEFDPESGLALSYSPNGPFEWGTVNLANMERLVAHFGVIERDLDFEPCTRRELGT